LLLLIGAERLALGPLFFEISNQQSPISNYSILFP
jgi:hypothetical protein